MFLENSCTFYDRQVILLNIVILRSSLAQNSQAVHHRDFRKVRQLNKSNPLRYMTNGSKNKETTFCRISTPLSGSLAMG